MLRFVNSSHHFMSKLSIRQYFNLTSSRARFWFGAEERFRHKKANTRHCKRFGRDGCPADINKFQIFNEDILDKESARKHSYNFLLNSILLRGKFLIVEETLQKIFA